LGGYFFEFAIIVADQERDKLNSQPLVPLKGPYPIVHHQRTQAGIVSLPLKGGFQFVPVILQNRTVDKIEDGVTDMWDVPAEVLIKLSSQIS
jgi:hypothetical protein